MAVLGIHILQSGKFISNYGLPNNVVVIINFFNILCFANVIKFSDLLDVCKVALSYIIIGVVIKFIIEIFLIVEMIEFIQIIHVLMSLSIPNLGITSITA